MSKKPFGIATVIVLYAIVVSSARAQFPPLPDVLPDPQGYWGWGQSAANPAPTRPAPIRAAEVAATACTGFYPDTFCATRWGWQWFGLRQPNSVITFRAWSNLSPDPVHPEPCPLTFTFHFGDGTMATAPGSSSGNTEYVQVTHKYAQGGNYTVTVTATWPGVGSIDCTMTTISIYSCWQDGVLCYRGDNLVWNRPAPYTYGVLDMDPPVSVNQTLMSTGHARIEYTYDGSGACTKSVFTPTGRTYVPLADRQETLFNPAGSLDVAWNQGEMVPMPGSPTNYDFKLGGVPLLVAANKPLVVGTDSVTVRPEVWIGIPDVLDLCRMSGEVLLPRNGQETVLKAELVQGEMTPSISFVNCSMKYDPATNSLDVRTGAKIPFSKWLVGESGYSLDAQWGFKNCGLNRAKVTIGGIKWDIPLGGYPPAWFVLNDFVGELDHVCDAEGFLIGVGGRGNLCVGPAPQGCVAVPGEFFRVSDMMLAFQYPGRFILRGGTPQVLGYPIGNAKAVFNLGDYPVGLHIDGWMNVAGFLQGAAGVGVSVRRLAIVGQLEGTFKIPDFTCRGTSYGCRALKTAMVGVLGALPVKLSGISSTIDGVFSPSKMTFDGAFRNMTTVGPLSLAFQISVDASGAGLLVGTNYENMIDLIPHSASAAVSLASAEQSVTLASARHGVVFAVTSSTTTVPSLSLRTPAGSTITPANVGSFPGVLHTAYAPEATAAYVVTDAAAGAWTMSVANLAPGQVTFTALTPQPPPVVAVTGASLAGDALDLTARVAPARPQTTVTFLLATAPDGGVVEPIGEPQPAGSGSVALSWSAAELGSGTYYVGARVDDGMNPPVTVFSAQPIVVDRALLAPPGGLTGTRDGGSVRLTWTLSPSASAAGTTILFTDRPELPGYPLADSGTTSAAITIGGLDPAKEYAFVAVAYDADGNQSVPSSPWTTAAAAPAAATALPPGVPVSDSGSGGAMRVYVVRVPVDATTLTVATAAASADLTLYLKRAAAPTTSTYDYRAQTSAWDESVTVTRGSTPVGLSAGDWYVGVRAGTAATYAVTATIRAASPCTLWCDATGPAVATVGSAVPFVAAPTVSGCGGTTTYDWDFGDGTPHATAASPTHAWSAEGSYTWILTVTADGRTCVSSGTTAVSPTPTRRLRRNLPPAT